MTMPEPSEVVTIRRLPDGDAQPARVAVRTSDRLALVPAGGPEEGFEAGTLVEIEDAQALYLGQVVGRQPDSLVDIAVEHFIDRAALAEIEKAWKDD